MKSEDFWVCLCIVIGILGFWLIFVGALLWDALDAHEHQTQQEKACVQSGQQWVYQNDTHQCIRKN